MTDTRESQRSETGALRLEPAISVDLSADDTQKKQGGWEALNKYVTGIGNTCMWFPLCVYLCVYLAQCKLLESLDFLGRTVDKNLPTNTGDTGLILGLRRFHMLWNS